MTENPVGSKNDQLGSTGVHKTDAGAKSGGEPGTSSSASTAMSKNQATNGTRASDGETDAAIDPQAMETIESMGGTDNIVGGETSGDNADSASGETESSNDTDRGIEPETASEPEMPVNNETMEPETDTSSDTDNAETGVIQDPPIDDPQAEVDSGIAHSDAGDVTGPASTKDQCSAAAETSAGGSCDECTYQFCCEERLACDNDPECPEAWGAFSACVLERNPENNPSLMPVEDLFECLYMVTAPLENSQATEDLANCATTPYDPDVHGAANRVEGDGLCSLSCFNIYSVAY